MNDVVLAFLSCSFLVGVWYYLVFKKSNDFAYLVFAFLYMSGADVGGLWIIRSRHIMIPFLLIVLYILRHDIHKNMTPLCGISIFLLVMIWGGCLWGAYPYEMFFEKGRPMSIAIIVLLIGCTINTPAKYSDLLITLTPVALMSLYGFMHGYQEIDVSEGRLSINEINPNGLSICMGIASVILLQAALYVKKIPTWMKVVLYCFIAYGLMQTLRTGSRNGIFSTVTCVGITLLCFCRTKTTIIIYGGIVFALIGIGYILVWNKLSPEIIARLLDFENWSGRDEMWREYLYSLKELPFYGCGSNIWVNGLNNVAWSGTMNIYLDVFYELKWIGALLGGFLLIGICCKMISVWRMPLASEKFAVLGFCIFGLLAGIGESVPLRPPHIGSLIFFVAIGILCSISTKSWKKSDQIRLQHGTPNLSKERNP